MEIRFKNNKIKKICSDEKERLKKCGKSQARVLEKRLAALLAADSLADIGPLMKRPERLHAYSGDKLGKLSVDLDGPYRLIFRVDQDSVPRLSDGSLDLSKIVKIVIEEIYDPH